VCEKKKIEVRISLGGEWICAERFGDCTKQAVIYIW